MKLGGKEQNKVGPIKFWKGSTNLFALSSAHLTIQYLAVKVHSDKTYRGYVLTSCSHKSITP